MGQTGFGKTAEPHSSWGTGGSALRGFGKQRDNREQHDGALNMMKAVKGLDQIEDSPTAESLELTVWQVGAIEGSIPTHHQNLSPRSHRHMQTSLPKTTLIAALGDLALALVLSWACSHMPLNWVTSPGQSLCLRAEPAVWESRI